MNIGRTIKFCRNQRDLSQTELAKKAGFSVSYLSLLEQNKRDPSISTIERIAFALNIPLNILIFLASEKNELSAIEPELAEKLSYSALSYLNDSTKNQMLL